MIMFMIATLVVTYLMLKTYRVNTYVALVAAVITSVVLCTLQVVYL